MRRTLPPVVLAIALLSSTGAWQGPPSLADRIQRIENGLLPPVLIKGRSDAMKLVDRMKYYRVPGVSVAVINNGRIEWARGYGVIEAGGTQPVTSETLFEAGSISKPVAAMAVLRLVEQGKLDLDEDVNQKLVSWKVPENEFTKEKKVTLRGLLSHSAGMTVHGFPGYAADAEVPTLVKVLDGAKPANTAAIRVDTIPGTKWRYSGGGYTVMQQLLVDVTRKSFPDLTRELVLVPMGMKHSTYEQPLPKTLAPSAATAHRNGEKVKGLYHTYPEMAAAGLWTTPSDLALWLIEVQRAVAAQSNKIISTRMANQMVTRQFGDSGLGPALEGQGASTRFGHGGVDEGFEASMIAYVHFGQGAVVMTNGNRGVQLAQEVVRSIAKEYAWLDYLPKEREVARVDPKIYEAYVGQYELNGMTVAITLENGRLFRQLPGRSKDELYPESETKFFLSVPAEPRLSFIKDDKGEVVEMIHTQVGGEWRAKKIKATK
jgi:CubicO group peptidase (beta-lactamase class C family)